MQITLINHLQGYELFKKLWIHCKAQLMAGNKIVVEARLYDDMLSTQQRKYLHGVIYNEIAKQAVIDGRKYSLAIWKEYARNKFLGEKIETVINPMTGAERKEVVRVSSESLTVKQYTLLIEQVTAWATTDLNVNFYMSFDEWQASESN